MSNASGGDFEARLTREVPAGTVLFTQGDSGNEMYIIRMGRVQLTRRMRGRESHLATLPPGEFFGEMAIINGAPRSATAQVIEDSQLLVLDGDTFEAMLRHNSEVAVRMIKKLAARLAQANTQVETLLVQDMNHRVVHFLRSLAMSRGQRVGIGVRVDTSPDEIGTNIGLMPEVVEESLLRLERARLLTFLPGEVVIPEVGRLDEFLEFLELRDKFGE